MPKQPAKKPAILDPQGRITVLLAEYQALYRLAEFRMGALDRRVPAAGAAIVAFLGSVPLLPERAGVIILVAIPISVVWFVRTTINHARSLEDLLRAIEAAERTINRTAGAALLAFQSNHPSRGKAVGGRTGFETVSAVGLASAVLIGACAYLADTPGSRPVVSILYVGYLIGVAGTVLRWLVLWKRYRYR